MKGYGKRLFALTLTMMLAGSTLFAPLIVKADNETLIKKDTQTKDKNILEFNMSGAKPVLTSAINNNKALYVKRDGDTFDVYQLAYVDWVKTTINNSEVVNADIKWVPELETWMKEKGFTKDGTTTGDVLEPLDYGKEQATTKTDANVIDLLKAIEADETGILATLKAKYYAGYHNDKSDPTLGNSTSSMTYTDPTDASATVSKINVTAYDNYGEEGRYFNLQNMQYGIYMVLGNSSDARSYQPLMIDMVPEQTGPTGNWYMNAEEVANLKYELINIDKTVNVNKEGLSKDARGEYDIVGAGEIVDFEITVDVPKYPVKENPDGSTIFTSTLFNGYDIMEGGYELIPTSARIYFKDKDGNIAHPIAALSVDANGNLKATDGQNGVPATYTAMLGTDAVCYYDTSLGEDIGLYKVETERSNGTKATTFYGVVQGKMVEVGPTLTDALSTYNSRLTTVGESGVTTNQSILATRRLDDTDPTSEEIKKSFISCEWHYTDLMTSLKYTEAGENMIYAGVNSFADYKDEDGNAKIFVPDEVYITYSAIINDKSFLGSDLNKNVVKVGFISDSAQRIDYIWDETTVWTYGVNIVKIDGATQGDKGTPRVDADGNPVTDENGDPIYDPTYLANAIFDLYQLDTVYCGGSTATAAPASTDYSNYNWYSDKNTNLDNYDKAEDDWQATLKKVATSYFAEKNGGQDRVAIAADVTAYLGTVYATTLESMTTDTTPVKMGGGWKTADKFENKYKTLFASIGVENTDSVYEYYNKYITGSKYQMIPVLVDKCNDVNTPHYHLNAFQIVRSNVTSVAEAEGITVNGLDLGTYLLVETASPDGYNLLNDAIMFEMKSYSEQQATLADGKISYKGFISDKKLDDPASHVDGDGYLQDGTDYYLSYPDGVYPLVVENYTGLTLPSTGGIGTMLFTLLGVAIMGGAFVIVFVKGRKERKMYQA